MRVLAAAATLLGVLMRNAAQFVIADLIAMGGVWLINNYDRFGSAAAVSAAAASPVRWPSRWPSRESALDCG